MFNNSKPLKNLQKGDQLDSELAGILDVLFKYSKQFNELFSCFPKVLRGLEVF
jgi:hypothetical protein